MKGISLPHCLNQCENNGDDRELELISFVSYSADNGGMCGMLKARQRRWPEDDFILMRFIKGSCQSNACWEIGDWPSGPKLIKEEKGKWGGEKSPCQLCGRWRERQTEEGTLVHQQPSTQTWWLQRRQEAEWGGGTAGKEKDTVVLKFPWDDPTPALSGKPEGHCCC